MSDQRTTSNQPARRPTGEVSGPPESIQPAAQNRATGVETVTIACNLPMGHILQIHDIHEDTAYLPNGQMIKENVCTLNLSHGQWALHGPVNFSSLLAIGRDVNVDFRIIKGDTPDTGYALTPGIPRDFWERWLEIHKRDPIVTNGHIFAASSQSRAVSQAKEYREFKSGFQPINQDGDYRVPNGRGIRKFDRNDNRTEQSEVE